MRLGPKELTTLRRALRYYLDEAGLGKGDATYCEKLLVKMDQQSERKEAPLVAAGAPGPKAGPIHDALIAASDGKVASMAGATPAWWARASRAFGKLQATEDKARTLGGWISRQSWLTGPVGWDTVLHKWEDWHARATSEGGATAPGSQAGRRQEGW
jgi:hypothetical protein